MSIWLDIFILDYFDFDSYKSLRNLQDWEEIQKFYGLEVIKEKVLQIRSMNKKTLNFLSFYFDTPLTDFRCYNITQSTQQHWNY